VNVAGGALGVSSDAKDERERGAWISNEPASYDPPATHADARAGCPIKTDEARMAEFPLKRAVATARESQRPSWERCSESPAARWRRSTSVSEVRAVRPTTGRPEPPTGIRPPPHHDADLRGETSPSLGDDRIERISRQRARPPGKTVSRGPAISSGGEWSSLIVTS